MTKLIDSRFVLAVKDLAASKKFYCDVLDFAEEPIQAAGWAFLRRDAVALMLGECPDARPASELADHAWFAYLLVDDARGLSAEIRGKGGKIVAEVTDQPWAYASFRSKRPTATGSCLGSGWDENQD